MFLVFLVCYKFVILPEELVYMLRSRKLVYIPAQSAFCPEVFLLFLRCLYFKCSVFSISPCLGSVTSSS